LFKLLFAKNYEEVTEILVNEGELRATMQCSGQSLAIFKNHLAEIRGCSELVNRYV